MARSSLTFDELVYIAKRTGAPEVVAAPSSHRGHVGKMGSVVGCTRHHTGTDEGFKPDEDYPTYQVVKEGRPGLENSLSAFGLGRYRGIYVFSEDVSWHAGTWNWQGITDGNGHFLGIEAEGTGRIWTPFQREYYPRLCASILDYIGEGIDMMPRHADGATPKGRKDDAKNLWPEFTAQVAAMLADPSTITKTDGTLEDVMTDVASLKFVAASNSPNTVWVTDGLVRRLVQADEVLLLTQLGLAEPHIPKNGNQSEVVVAVIAPHQVERLAVVEGSGWLAGYPEYRRAPVSKVPTAVEIAEALATRLPTLPGGQAYSADEIAQKVDALLAARLAA